MFKISLHLFLRLLEYNETMEETLIAYKTDYCRKQEARNARRRWQCKQVGWLEPGAVLPLRHLQGGHLGVPRSGTNLNVFRRRELGVLFRDSVICDPIVYMGMLYKTNNLK